MTIPIEIIAAVLAALLSAMLAGLGFTIRKLTHIDVRTARIEEHLNIGIFKKHE